MQKKHNVPDISPEEGQKARDQQVKENPNASDISPRERQKARDEQIKVDHNASDISPRERQKARDEQIKVDHNASDIRPRERQGARDEQVKTNPNASAVSPTERQRDRDEQVKEDPSAPDISPRERQGARDEQVKENPNASDISPRGRQGDRDEQGKGDPSAPDISPRERQRDRDEQVKGDASASDISPRERQRTKNEQVKRNPNASDTSPKERQTPSEQQVEEDLNNANITPEERQKARKQHLEEYCRNHTYNKSPGKKDVYMLAVDDDLRLIYCVVPKVATSTWKTVIAKSRNIRPGINRWTMWERLSNYTEEERNERLKTYFKFVFVREPLQRLLSAYKNKFLQIPRYTKDLRKEIVKALRPQDLKPKGKNVVKFKEFIQYFSSDMSRNQHWRQYEKLCHPCVIDYDFIGHLETLKEDAALFLQMAGIDGRVTFPQIHKSTGPSEVLKYYSTVPLEYINRLGEQYRNDFEMFGYEYLGPVKKLLKEYSKD